MLQLFVAQEGVLPLPYGVVIYTHTQKADPPSTCKVPSQPHSFLFPNLPAPSYNPPLPCIRIPLSQNQMLAPILCPMSTPLTIRRDDLYHHHESKWDNANNTSNNSQINKRFILSMMQEASKGDQNESNQPSCNGPNGFFNIMIKMIIQRETSTPPPKYLRHSDGRHKSDCKALRYEMMIKITKFVYYKKNELSRKAYFSNSRC